MIIAVSKYVLNQIKNIDKKAHVELVYNSMDLPEITIPKKKRIVATVGYFSDFNKVKLKGLDVFLECAKRIEDVTFLIIGVDDTLRKKIVFPPNVIVRGRMDRDQVLRELSSVKVYCQFSMLESFGMATLEAMSLNCLPVVSNRGALPELVRDSGYIVPYGDIEKSTASILKALNQKNNFNPRKRVETFFNNDKKIKKYQQIISNIASEVK